MFNLKKFSTLTVFILLTSCSTNQNHIFKYSDPETAGFSSAKLDSLQTHLINSGSSSLIILQGGNVVYEWGQTDKIHTIHSIRKALINSLYGIGVHENLIDTNETLKELNINDIMPLSEQEKSARIADLLKSRSGVYHTAAANAPPMVKHRPDRNTFKPGEKYFYNNWDFNVLGKILELRTGKSIYELFKNKIAIPIGMHDYNGTYKNIDGEDETEKLPNTDGFYQYERSKSNYPAYHFRMSARDLALYGQLYLNKGQWGGKQIIPSDWIEQSTKPFSLYNKYYGIAYGMLWNVLVPNKFRETKSFYHTGLNVHMLGIYPESKLVLVHRVDTEKPYQYKMNDFYKMIELVFDAKIK